MNIPPLLRRLIAGTATLSVLPAVAAFLCKRLLLEDTTAISGTSEAASRWAGTTGILRRRALYGLLLQGTGEKLSVGFGTVFSTTEVWFGDRVYMGQHCSLGHVRIHDEAMIADHVVIPSGTRQHGTARLDVPMRLQPGELRTVSIGRDCWVGSGGVVLADVGDHSIVAAGAVVTGAVPPEVIVAGVPARVVSVRKGSREAGRS